MRPGEDCQAQVDGCRVEGIDGIRKLQPEVVVRVKPARQGDQTVGQLGVDAPVALLVCVCQSRAPNRFPKAHVVKFGLLNRKAGFDVAQAFTIRQLRKCHCPVLLGAGQGPHAMVASISSNNPVECFPWQEIQALRCFMWVA